MGVLAHVFEHAGLATVGLSLIRGQAEAVAAPRMLHCQFPLGRPLGRPGDAAFQHDVLRRALALLERTDVPVLVDHPEVIDDLNEIPASCPLPPRSSEGHHAAIGEMRGLRAAYDRQLAASGRTMVGRVTDADGMEASTDWFVKLAAGVPLEALGVEAETLISAGQDLRAYYEEAALALMDHVPEARQTESWYFSITATGQLVKQATTAMKAAGVSRSITGYLMPSTQ